MGKFKLGVALGGGGVRGFANISTLKVLEENNIVPDIVVGSSMGAIMGAMYGDMRCSDKVVTRVKKVLNSSVFKEFEDRLIKKNIDSANDNESSFFLKRKVVNCLKAGYIFAMTNLKLAALEDKDVDIIREVISQLIPDIKIEDLSFEFGVTTTSLKTGRPFLHRKGSLREIILASISIPGIFPPVAIDDDLCLDGAILAEVPVSEVKKMGADFVMAVNLRMIRDLSGNINNIKDILNYCHYVSNNLLNDIVVSDADFVVDPDVKTIHWADFSKADLIIKKGEEMMSSVMVDFKRALRKKRFKNRFLGFF